MNFDSPSATAALGALGIHGNLDLNLDNLSMGALGLGRADEDERKKRMDTLALMMKVYKSSTLVETAITHQMLTSVGCWQRQGQQRRA